MTASATPENYTTLTDVTEASAKRKFKAYPIGYFHIDIAEVRTAQGKLYLLVHRPNLEVRLRRTA